MHFQLYSNQFEYFLIEHLTRFRSHFVPSQELGGNLHPTSP